MSAVDYERHGVGYAAIRRGDARIASQVHAALGTARTVLNVGAGAGSYEPHDRHVVAVEPAAAGRTQRPRELPPAVAAAAESLPFDDDAFDAAMAILIVEAETGRFPALAALADTLGEGHMEPVPVALDCTDGFLEAFYGHPEALLRPAVRRAQSVWHRLAPGVEERAIARLAADLETGAWDAQHGSLRTTPRLDGALRLVVAAG